ncbi:MAG: opioid growth factor receptor-related protein [Acidobacteriota bacterium]|nr:opioid growth factor receptor-related protein [Acidobacteriota bacterium]
MKTSTQRADLTGFYRGEVADVRGRYLREMQGWPDELLETRHDFIQWMFPLREASGFNPHAPLLDARIIAEFRTDARIQENLRMSFARMLDFYGFWIDAELRVGPSAEFGAKTAEWLSTGNHNYLRITRILKSLRLLGLEREAQSFFRALEQLYEEESRMARPRIGERTFRFWTDAVGQG